MNIPEAEYFASLPKKRIGAAAVFSNASDELLIVKPTYKNNWLLPGGTVEENESPLEGCRREVVEEIGIRDKPFRLIAVDWQIHDIHGESILFLFSGGILSDEDINSIRLQEEELSEYIFLPVEKACGLLSEGMKKRILHIFDSAHHEGVLYLEDGELL